MCRAMACVGLLFLLPSGVSKQDAASGQLNGRRRALLAAHSWLNLQRPPAWTKCGVACPALCCIAYKLYRGAGK